MAKQAVGPVVRYLDKAVLAAAAGGFIYVFVMFGVVSPNKIETASGDAIGPGDVDREIRDAAERLRERLISHKPPTEGGSAEPVNPLPELMQASRPLEFAKVDPTIPRAVSYGPPVPKFKGYEVQKTDLVETVRLPAPKVISGRSGVHLAPAETLGEAKGGGAQLGVPPEDINWATIYGDFDIAEQVRRFKEAGYDAERQQVRFMSLDVERRERLADGTYTDWKPVITSSPTKLPDQPEVKVTPMAGGGGHTVDQLTQDDVVNFAELIGVGENQLELLRPCFYEGEYGDEWFPPQPGEYSLRQMDEAYGVSDRRCGGGPTAAVDLATLDVEELLKRGNAAIDAGKLDEATKIAEIAEGKASSTLERRRVGELLEAIEKARQAGAGVDVDRQLPVQLVWAHDAAISGGLRSGRTYQYRHRAVLFNPYCGFPALLNTPEDAEKVTLPLAEWSEPSEDVTISLDTMFFVSRGDESKGEVSVDVYKWYGGAWLSKRFTVKVGDTIGDIARVNKAPPRDEPASVNFDTEMRVVDIDFRRTMQGRNRNSSKLKAGETTVALIYLDPSGRLQESLEGLDKVDPRYSEMRSVAYK